MILMQFEIHSKVLQMDTDVWCLVPGNEAGFGTPKAVDRWKVLWLLHGGSDNYADWHDCTPVQVLADKYNYAVVMPDAQTSSYAIMAYGPNWLDYFRTELPEYIYSHFPISRRREDNFISGMSMGGGGALKLSLLW